jgi:hypothetical protein
MMSEMQVTAMRDDCERALDDWKEPDGILVPTIPNPLEREIHRERLRVGLDLLNRILVDSGRA